MTSQNRKQRIPIHKESNISSTKGNQAMTFGHLLECEIYFCSKIMQKMKQGDIF